jgi:hypothetical protein
VLPTAGFAVGCALNIVGNQVPPWIGWTLIAISVLLAAYYLVIGRQNMFPAIGMVVSFVCLIGFSVWYYRSSQTPKLVDIAQPAPKTYPTPLTLRNIFDTDFSNQMTYGGEAESTDVDGTHVTISWLVVADFIARTKYLAYYIPRSPKTVNICAALTSGYQQTLDDADKRVEIRLSIPGDSADTALRDLRFSGRIYIYLEQDLPLQQLAALEAAFNNNNAAVQFRGSTYRTLHWNEKRVMTSKDAQLQQVHNVTR